jgi:hypothetical protein
MGRQVSGGGKKKYPASTTQGSPMYEVLRPNHDFIGVVQFV